MANSQQAERIIDRLYERTVNASIGWTPSAEAGRFQARLGDFLIQIGDPAPMLTATGVAPYFVVTRLSGTNLLAVAHSSSLINANAYVNSVAASAYSFTTQPKILTRISDDAHRKLAYIWSMITDKSEDLEELIRLL